MIESVSERGEFYIDNSAYLNQTNDKIYINCVDHPGDSCGHYYSEKPPLLSLLGVLIYIFFSLLGLKLLIPYFLSIFLVGIPFCILIIVFFDSMKMIGLKEKYCFFLAYSLGFGTILFSYTSLFINHIFAAMLFYFSFYMLLKVKYYKSENIRKDIFLSGLFLGFSSIIDYTCLAFIPLMILYLLSFKNMRNYIIYFAFGLIIPIGLHLIINLLIYGTYKPAYFIKGAYDNSVWLKINSITLNNKSSKFSNVLVGNNGLFTFSPILIFPIISMFLILFRRIKEFLKEAFLTIICIIIVVLSYSTKLKLSLDSGYSFRFIIPLIPLIMFFFGYLFRFERNKYQITLYLLVIFVSMLFSILGFLFFRFGVPFQTLLIDYFF